MGQAAERGLYMIEIIREESFDSEQEKREKELPKIDLPEEWLVGTGISKELLVWLH